MMTDREKINMAIAKLQAAGDIALAAGCELAKIPAVDALDIADLLKEQEPMEPHVEHDSEDDSWYYGCGACHEAIDYKDKFCRHCGREVKWDD